MAIDPRLAAALAGRYTVEGELGHGGMAVVYLARDVKHGRAVAIKVLRPELTQAVGSQRFLREINIAAQLQSPHILPLLESGEADGVLFYIMPYVKGDSLRGLLAKHGTLPVSEAMRLLRDVVDALAHAHRHGVVHRDIKPDNVMIADRHALVVDFGVAKAMSHATSSDALTSIGVSLGTPAYMAPEQAAADPGIDHRADIYAAGILAYEMLTGRPPFTGPPQAVLAAQISSTPVPLASVRPDVSPAVARIVDKCLEKDPAQRYQTADDLLVELEGLVTPAGASRVAPPSRRSRVTRAAVVAAGILAIILVGAGATKRLLRDRWVHRTALPELNRLVEAAEQDSAYELALQIEQAAPLDSTLASLWPRFTRRVVLHTSPEGAGVYRASMADTSRWHFLGTTPTDTIRVPNRAGLFRYEKPGFRTAYNVFIGPAVALPLDSSAAPHPEMVRIPGELTRAFLVGTDGAPPVQLDEYRMDRFEVSNREYKAFVDAGGYRNRTYWEHPFQLEGRRLAWDEAMARFADRTGRTGPANWEGGTFQAGQGDLPVGGVSWYEAAAYAKYAGKSLPTIYHWSWAASIENARFVVPSSVFEARAPGPVGTLRGISKGGVSDLAGNVREWCFNEAGGDERYILGGGWTDPTYAFPDAYAQPPMQRAPINGIRLVKYDPSDTSVARASLPIARAFTDYSREKPAPDAVFAGFTPLFEYDPVALAPKVERRDTTAENWIAEKVSFAAAYGDERVIAWVFIPKRGTPPYQTVVMFPGSGAMGAAPHSGNPDPRTSFIVQSGRVAVMPIFRSTFERSDSLRTDVPNKSIFWRDHVAMWVKDYRRTLEYLSTRADIDTSRFAYFGYSWGGSMGGIIPAVEPRIKAAVLYVAGLPMERPRPEVDPVHYLPRVRVPVLMLNGKYDFYFPIATAQEPFFRMLGTPASDKRYIVYEGGHDVPRTQLIAESLAWFDKYLGPVR